MLIGKNGTGKTHLMKVAYAACDITKGWQESEVFAFKMKLNKVFRPWGGEEDLIRMKKKSNRSEIEVYWGSKSICEVISYDRKPLGNGISIKGPPRYGSATGWAGTSIDCAYIPPKDILANSPGFQALYKFREILFEEIYPDILIRAQLPRLQEDVDTNTSKLLHAIEREIGGKIEIEGETFFLRIGRLKLDFMLVAEGLRKLGLLWILLQNGTLSKGSVLFWDEPEANLNPSLYGVVVDILLELHRMGVQIFIATHDYVILKEIDLKMKKDDVVMFHSLYKVGKSKEVKCHSTSDYLQIEPNAIADTFSSLFDREIARPLNGQNP